MIEETLVQNISEYPENFRIVSVVSVSQLSPSFLRVRISGSDFRFLNSGPLHFRINLQPPGVEEPNWPHVNEEGKTIWPSGDQTLHRPVYTIRWMDVEAGLMDFDVFIHEGGRVTEWVLNASAGDEFGVTGPGGGSTMSADWMLLAGDETAYPAIARILEIAPPETTGRVILQGEGEYPLPEHEGFRIEYLKRGENANSLYKQLISLPFPVQEPDSDNVFIWIAADKADTMPLRTHFRETLAFTRQNSFIAGFWSS